MKALIASSLLAFASACNLRCTLNQCNQATTFQANLQCMKTQCGCDLLGSHFSTDYSAFVRKCMNSGSYACETHFPGNYDQCMSQVTAACKSGFVPQKFLQMNKKLANQKTLCLPSLSKQECQGLLMLFNGQGLFAKDTIMNELPKDYRDAMKEASKHMYSPKNTEVPNMNLYSLNITFNDLDIDFNFNDQLFEQYASDVMKFQQGYEQAKHRLGEQFGVNLADAYKTFLAKLYLEYGETFGPVYDAWADYVNSLDMGDSCDTACVADSCFNPRMHVDYTCVENCGCKFNYDEFKSAYQGVEEAYRDLFNKLGKDGEEILSKFEPTIKAY